MWMHLTEEAPAPAAGKGKSKADQSQPKDLTPKKEDYCYVLFASYGDRSRHTSSSGAPAQVE